MAENNDADAVRLRAVLRDSLANERTNPAVAAEREHAPRQWTDAEVAELVASKHGTEDERLAPLIEEANNRSL